jgi:hypothetical protein
MSLALSRSFGFRQGRCNRERPHREGADERTGGHCVPAGALRRHEATGQGTTRPQEHAEPTSERESCGARRATRERRRGRRAYGEVTSGREVLALRTLRSVVATSIHHTSSQSSRSTAYASASFTLPRTTTAAPLGNIDTFDTCGSLNQRRTLICSSDFISANALLEPVDRTSINTPRTTIRCPR